MLYDENISCKTTFYFIFLLLLGLNYFKINNETSFDKILEIFGNKILIGVILI